MPARGKYQKGRFNEKGEGLPIAQLPAELIAGIAGKSRKQRLSILEALRSAQIFEWSSHLMIFAGSEESQNKILDLTSEALTDACMRGDRWTTYTVKADTIHANAIR